MRFRVALLPGLLLALILALAVVPVHAQDGSGIVLTDQYVLNEGETVEGDLLVTAPTITLQHGSHVEGDVALLGKTITIRGRITGNLVVMGSEITLESGAVIEGNANLCGQSIQRDDAAAVAGTYNASCDGIGNLIGGLITVPVPPDPSDPDWNWEQFDPDDWDWDEINFGDIQPPRSTPLQRLAWSAGWTLAMGAMAGLCALIFPYRLRRISNAALSAPLATGGVGILSIILAVVVSGVVFLSLVLVITVILVPFVGLAWLALALLTLVGWAALSLPVGTWLLMRMNMRRVSPIAAAAVGALALTAAVAVLSVSEITALLGCGLLALLWGWGLGAVILTRLGTQAYPNPYPHQST